LNAQETGGTAVQPIVRVNDYAALKEMIRSSCGWQVVDVMKVEM
jgi:diphthamide synthase (EF-2-diphthine--ammonia ligase)